MDNITWRDIIRAARKHGKAAIIADLEAHVRVLTPWASTPIWGSPAGCTACRAALVRRQGWIARLQPLTDADIAQALGRPPAQEAHAE